MIAALLSMWVLIAGESMVPALLAGRFYLATETDTLRCGDVVVFEAGSDLSVKRIVGVPGDSLAARGLDVPRKGRAQPVIPDSCYYLMGDNWRHSRDSRHFGHIHRRHIRGVIRKEPGAWDSNSSP